MTIDPLAALASVDTTAGHSFFQPGYSSGWTDDRLRRWLDSTGEKYTAAKSTRADRDNGMQYNFATCPLCKEGEGNPAVWLHDGAPCFKCFRNHCGDKSFRDVQASFKRPAVKRINVLELARIFAKARESVVEGLIRRGDVVNIVGGPKARKSFLVALLAICVAAGIKFLAWPTVKSKVLLIDNELQGDDLTGRLRKITAALGLDWEVVGQNIDAMKLRGTLSDLYVIRDELKTTPGEYGLVIVDALYKALPDGTDENSNSDMTRAYVTLDSIAESNECGTVAVHHTSKGIQVNKSITDIGSGAGAQSRSADAHIVLREHEEENVISLQAVIRALPPVKPVCIKFDWPLWTVVEDRDPNRLSLGPSHKASVSLDVFVAAIPTEPTRLKTVHATLKAQFNLSRETTDCLMNAAKDNRLVEIGILKGKGSPQTIKRTTA